MIVAKEVVVNTNKFIITDNDKDDSKEACFCESIMFEPDYETLEKVPDDWPVANIESLKVQTECSTKQTPNLFVWVQWQPMQNNKPNHHKLKQWPNS